jgi:glycosyltransferase involved in cell wall biosynthesis
VYNYDAYVFLTEAMNKVINKHNVPYIIMEGLVDSDIKIDSEVENLSNTKNILYAGGMHERYGLKTLVEAFMRINGDFYRLCIYGSGPFVNDLIEKYCKKDNRIHYMGVVPNSEVVKAEYQSILLVNPRPTTEAFTKYSFPSKNMEYMVSGRPLLTTNLPGMPSEYHEYVYIFESEDVLGFEKSLKQILSLSENELYKKGQSAKRWILDNKNNKIQTARIINMVIQIKD